MSHGGGGSGATTVARVAYGSSSTRRDRRRDPLSYEEAVREALCFGWIDSTSKGVDADRYRLWMAPRKSKSGWAASNKRRIEELIATGAMTDAGMAVVDAAKADGSWNALDRSEALEVPDDLSAAFDCHEGSRANWDGFPPGARKQMLWWIDSAKREQTRAKRIEETATLAARNERANEWRPKA